eukprot:10075955-Ditylum_brightwellii.AAC.1
MTITPRMVQNLDLTQKVGKIPVMRHGQRKFYDMLPLENPTAMSLARVLRGWQRNSQWVQDSII